jgi:hypothetical protein
VDRRRLVGTLGALGVRPTPGFVCCGKGAGGTPEAGPEVTTSLPPGREKVVADTLARAIGFRNRSYKHLTLCPTPC